MSTDSRSRVDKGVSTGGQFAKENKSEDASVSLTGKTDLQRALAMLAELDKPKVERGPDGTINEMVRQHGQRTFTVEANDERFDYSIYEDQEEVAYFTASEGSIASEDELWKEAVEELEASGVAEKCSECDDSIDDGEGYDGKCGNCADKEYAAEQEDDDEEEEVFCPKCQNLLEEGVDCEHCGPGGGDDEEEISRFAEQHDGQEVTVVREGYMDSDNYEVRDDQGNEILTFTHSGDEQDHSEIWESAKAALKEHEANSKPFTGIPQNATIIREPVTHQDSQGKPVVGSRYMSNGRDTIILAGEHGTVELWQEEWPDAESRAPMDRHRGGLEVHHVKPQYPTQKTHDGCQSVESGACYPDGSTMAYDDMKFAFVMQDDMGPKTLMQDYESMKPE